MLCFFSCCNDSQRCIDAYWYLRLESWNTFGWNQIAWASFNLTIHRALLGWLQPFGTEMEHTLFWSALPTVFLTFPCRNLLNSTNQGFKCRWVFLATGAGIKENLTATKSACSVCLLCFSFACFGQCSVSKVCSQRRLAQYAMFPGQVSGGQWTKTLEKHWLEGWTHVNSQHWSLRWQGVACYPGS